MPVSPNYQAFVLDQLRRVVPSVRAKRMFGAFGVYADELFFAVIDDDTLFFKVDDATRPEYEARGMPAFRPMKDMTSMNYFQVPEEVLEDPEALRPWAEGALGVARRAKSTSKRKGKTSRGSPRRRKP